MRRNYLFIILVLVASLPAFLILTYGVNPTQEKALIENQMINPNESVTAIKELKTGQQAQLIIHYPIFGIPLTANVKDPNGIVAVDINSTSYDKELYAVFQPNSNGKYTLTITNHGTQEVPIHVILGGIENSATSNPFK